MAVPCVVLVGLGVRIIVQQEELAEKHAADERRLLIGEFERALLVRLERVRADPADPARTFTATVSDGRLVLPWERPIADGAADPGFQSALDHAEQEEFGARRLDRAERAVRDALRLASAPRDIDHARLVLARLLVKTSRPQEAAVVYARLLAEPLTIADDQGVPFAFYAAEQLAQRAPLPAERRQVIESAIGASRPLTLPPAAWYLARAVTREHQGWLDARIEDVEQALALQRDLAGTPTLWRRTGARWLVSGTRPWLVGIDAGSDLVLVVRGDVVADAVRSSSDRLTALALAGGAQVGERLGDQLPELRVRFVMPPPALDLRLQRAFYAGALALVVGVTLFGVVLLLRDVRRELRLAELRSQFVSSVTHELKTPLTAIRMFAETLRLGRADAATRDEYLDTIVNESERLTRLLNNVLDFSNIEQGRKAYRLEHTSLVEVVRVAARAMEYPLAQHGFVLRLDIDEAVPTARVDADALEQAILNLLTNAMKYSGDARDIDLRLARDGDQAIIAVRDCGVGIALPEQTRIFEKFYRVQTPDNQRIPGTGLGLTLVEHIARAHEGSVRVESAPGQGSTFSIHVPLAGTAS